ncbi:beta-L-arabinofuranosidase domain-containing protein [Flavobacterium sp.]|uniref:beta-L-arabinofuranosidase domain-containing protein n=1 Tax=Flavobacterium sp. TaxID=239 RepID=UPI002617EBE2|nr:beta-L-arabinofuranosidase domain-containing protein [Flavobacterium sp.]
MRNIYLIIVILASYTMNSQEQNTNKVEEKYQILPFGSIKPSGWLKTQMQKDVDGFVGNLDKLVPDLINDPIYSSGRLHKNSEVKDLGNNKEGDAEGSEQYKWWNSETQSNWWDGYIRNVILLNDKVGLKKVKKYVQGVLKTQDEDGYIGIYDKDLRYQFNSENGELWSKATMYRGLLAYYEYTKDKKLWNAIVKAVNNVMTNYPIGTSSPFSSGNAFNGGVSHGLTFTDVLDKMYQITGDTKYTDYALFLYQDFSKTYQSEKDVQLSNILNPNYKLQSHGVHTYEHLRPLLVAAYASNNIELQKALQIYIQRIENTTTLTGGAIGDEWIAERNADATHTGYEYCSLHELLDSYSVLFQKQGNSKTAEAIETIFYNAAQGSRNPNHSCIAYLKTDNSFEMEGTKNGEVEANRKQTRYKYSPAHQDVAVCCNPNAGRITPYFIEKSWLKESDAVLVNVLLMPNVVETKIHNQNVKIETITEYPYQNKFTFKIANPNKTSFTLKIRKPSWVTDISTKEKYTVENDFLIFERPFTKEDAIELEFNTKIQIKEDTNKEKYFSYGALFYAKPIEAIELKGKSYFTNFDDLMYKPKDNNRFQFMEENQATFNKGQITIKAKNKTTNQIETVTLIPFGKTILRQVSF